MEVSPPKCFMAFKQTTSIAIDKIWPLFELHTQLSQNSISKYFPRTRQAMPERYEKH